MSRPLGTADELERRRKQAVEAVAQGQPRKTVAAVLGVHLKTVSRWVRAARQPGGLEAVPQRGPTPALTPADLQTLESLLRRGAKAHGWPNELWTAARVARLIQRHFQIDYHPEHVRKILTVCPEIMRHISAHPARTTLALQVRVHTYFLNTSAPEIPGAASSSISICDSWLSINDTLIFTL